MTAREPFAEGGRDKPEYARAQESGGTVHEAADIHRLLVESVQDYAIFVLDPTGHILTWNSGAERMKGYTADEAIGQHFSIFYPQEAVEIDHPGNELNIARAEGRYGEEGWRIRKDGSSFWASVTITALRDESGTLAGFAKVTRDLTDRKEAEQKAIADARKVAEAEAANRAKSEFLATMSHELRTPLNAIGGYVDLLTLGIHGPTTSAQSSALERIRTSQRHLLTLINDLLNFSKVDAGTVTYDVVPVDLSDMTEPVESMVEPQAVAKDIDLQWETSSEAVVALADPARLEQILLNLVTNAIKYTDAGGHVWVRCFPRGDKAVVEVIDTGAGIPEEFTEAIFEPFTQVGRSHTSPHEGTGLGLAISRDLARAMDGDLTVRSTVDEGSTFTLTLPTAE